MDTARIADELQGRLIAPNDPEYDAARSTFYGGIDKRPSLIVKAANTGDVARVIAMARDGGLELAVRSGGHSLGGHCVSDGGVVLDLGAMRGLEIDVDGRTAWVESGMTTGEYTIATGAHGLATGFGDSGSVGIGGIALGGGVGYLVRKHGLTIDDLLAADIVTADGEHRFVDEQDPDLFWAVRGGGANIGVATRLRFRLHEVGTIVGGMLFLPATPGVLASFMDAADSAPEELSTIVNVMRMPPMPLVPEEAVGQLAIMGMLVYAGDVEAGERAMTAFRSLAAPIADLVKLMPYPEIYPPEDDSFHPIAAAHTGFRDTFGRREAELIVERVGAPADAMHAVQLRVLGGAMARVPVDATAFAHRDRRIMVNVASLYAEPSQRADNESWVAGLAAELREGAPGAYVGFMGDEGEARVHDVYPGPTWDRLASIKARYDPENVFRLNQNVPPSV